ncbi:hypothetical protein [Clostridium tertium]|uniref:hypothetical protein n=1 Tax=Clostridium tertium TaxID=1559 RepID=UPI00291BFD8F|nr:hypothetical protein [Clostridium sp.]
MSLIQTFENLSTSDKIQIIAIFTSSLLSFISVIIAVVTLKQTNYITRESNRANLVFYINKNRTEIWPSLIIKNFGNSPGKLLKLEIDPPIKELNKSRKLITDYTDLFLAPNQSISSLFDINSLDAKLFNVKITYETLGKTYTDSYSINYEYRSSVIYTKTKTKTIEDALDKVNESIRELSDKLN